MKYGTPELKSAGAASKLIQFKAINGSDKTSQHSHDGISPAMET